MTLVFKPVDRASLELVYEFRRDEITREHNPLAPLSAKELAEKLLSSPTDWSEFATAESFFWVAECEGRVVGTASVSGINRMMLTADIGYGVFVGERGKGFAQAIVHQLTRDAFERSPLRKLVAFVAEENTASRRVLEKCGYKLEGLLREHYLINGAPVNECVYGRLRRELA